MSAGFKVKKMSVAEILYIMSTDVCPAASEYLKYNNNLRDAWNALRVNEGHLASVLSLLGIRKVDVEPAFPDELYKDIAKYFEPQLMPMKEIRGLIDGLEKLKYDHLKKKYKRGVAFDDEFDRFCTALEKYLNKRASSRGIQPWTGA